MLHQHVVLLEIYFFFGGNFLSTLHRFDRPQVHVVVAVVSLPDFLEDCLFILLFVFEIGVLNDEAGTTDGTVDFDEELFSRVEEVPLVGLSFEDLFAESFLDSPVHFEQFLLEVFDRHIVDNGEHGVSYPSILSFPILNLGPFQVFIPGIVVLIIELGLAISGRHQMHH